MIIAVFRFISFHLTCRLFHFMFETDAGGGRKEGCTYTTIGYLDQSGTKAQIVGPYPNQGKVFRTGQISSDVQNIHNLTEEGGGIGTSTIIVRH